MKVSDFPVDPTPKTDEVFDEEEDDVEEAFLLAIDLLGRFLHFGDGDAADWQDLIDDTRDFLEDYSEEGD